MDSHFHGNDREGSWNDRKEKTGLMNQAPTLGKIKKIVLEKGKRKV